jgi:hypothetical protein
LMRTSPLDTSTSLFRAPELTPHSVPRSAIEALGVSIVKPLAGAGTLALALPAGARVWSRCAVRSGREIRARARRRRGRAARANRCAGGALRCATGSRRWFGRGVRWRGARRCWESK